MLKYENQPTIIITQPMNPTITTLLLMATNKNHN